MKRLYIVFILLVGSYFTSNAANAISFFQVDCEQFAADATAVIEEHFGCLDSDTYNQVYNGHLQSCREITNQ